MEQVLGIGGVFFKARDPKALAAWYREHLGVPVEPEQTYGAFTSAAAGEQAVWSAFPADTSYFGSGPAPFMVNYRVRNLDAMLAQLRAAGAQVDDRVEDYDYGRFGWATDPEGNRFELWEPRRPDRSNCTAPHPSAEADRGRLPGFPSFAFTQGEAKGQTLLGIYEATEDTLRIAWSEPGKVRPTEIANRAGLRQDVWELRRE